MTSSNETPLTEAAAQAGKLLPFGKYLLLERVAVGGMAEVWLAKRMEDDGVSELLAVERILPHFSADADFVRMFVDEARIAGQLQHPGIIPMQELGRVGPTFYIVMEYVWGRDLLQILRTLKQSAQRLPFSASAYIAARVCEALHYAHVLVDKHGRPLELVHRDVSPQNVLVSFDGKVKLIDFGIAKATSRTTKTQAGTLKGKVGYMSPEQVRGLPVDGRSDLFAVGTLLYEMLTVRPLFARGNNFEVMNRVRDADVPPIETRVSDVPPALAQIVTRALSRDPADRYPTAQEMQRALTVFLAQHASSFERFDLATLLRRLYEDEFAREKARLDALDSIGRPAVSPVSKKYTNPVTSLEIATVSLFDEDDEDEATEVGAYAPYRAIQSNDGPSEVLFHRDEVVQVGESNPDGHTARPLRALFRPGKAEAVEAYRAPLVGRDDGPAPAPAAVVTPASGPRPASGRAGPIPEDRKTLVPPSSSAVPPPAITPGAPEPPRRPSVLPKRALTATQPLGTHALGPQAPTAQAPTTQAAASPSSDASASRTTLPHHAPASRPPPASEDVPIELSGSFLPVSSGEVSAVLAPEPHGPHAPLSKRAGEEDDETFEDGGIREPLVPPIVSRARIVAVSDQPPARLSAAVVPRRASPPDASKQPHVAAAAPLVAGDTPSAITRALEQMAQERSESQSARRLVPVEHVPTDAERLSGFALDPQQLDSKIIREILPPTGSHRAPKGDPTDLFPRLSGAGRVAHLPTLVPRATTSDRVFFALAALLTIALGSTAAVTALFADSAASLEVRCMPAVEATVIVDGRPRGRAPVRLDDVAPGQHTITVVAPGFEEAHRQVVVEPRASASVEVALTAAGASDSGAPMPAGVLPPRSPATP